MSLIVIIVGGVFLGAVGIYVIGIYNSLVSLKNQVSRAWANISVILKQRFDEVPQLISVVEQYVRYEKETIDKLVAARLGYQGATSIPAQVEASRALSSAIRGIMILGEGYPELKSNASFLQLQSRLSGLEMMLADRRELYNEAATNYNTRISMFPDSILASLFSYQSLPLFRVEAAEMVQPSLKIQA